MDHKSFIQAIKDDLKKLVTLSSDWNFFYKLQFEVHENSMEENEKQWSYKLKDWCNNFATDK